MQSELLVSVVTPFFNTAAYLEECIRSVLALNYRNFEYLLCDNCSTDGSRAIAERYAAMDPRIRVIPHTEFIGQDANYNRALRYVASTSHYVKIVQADDWIFPECLSAMVAAGERHPGASIVSACYIVGTGIGGTGLPLDREVFSGKEACRTRLTTGGTYFGSPTCLLYRADAVRGRHPFYGETDLHSDTQLCFELLKDADFVRVPRILMGFRRNNPSVSDVLRQNNSQLLLQYILTKKYGATYLTPEECSLALKQSRSALIKFLARAWLQRRDAEFWRFQDTGLAEVGERLLKRELLPSIAGIVTDKVFNPKATLQALASRLSNRQS